MNRLNQIGRLGKLSSYKPGEPWGSYWVTRIGDILITEVVSDTRIDLFWRDGVDAPDGLRIYISTDNISFTEKGSANYGDETFSATGLTPNTLYYFKLVSYKGTKESNPKTSSARTEFLGNIGAKSPYLFFDNFKHIDTLSDTSNNLIYRWWDITRTKYLSVRNSIWRGQNPLVDNSTTISKISFTRTTDSRFGIDFGEALSNVTIFLKYKFRNVTAGTNKAIVDGIVSGNRNLIAVNTSGKYYIFAGTARTSDYDIDTNVHYLTAVFAAAGANDILRIDGSEKLNIDAGSHTLTGIVLGNDYNYTDGCDIDIQKLIIYNSVLDEAEMAVVESYLAGEASKSLRNLHEYKQYQLNTEEYYWNEGTLGYFTRQAYFNNKHYLVWVSLGGTNSLNGNILTIDSNNAISSSKVIVAGTPSDTDGHDITSLILDNDGYIYGARGTGTGLSKVTIVKSDSLEDISAFTVLQYLENGIDGVSVDNHSYPGFLKSGTDLFLFCRSSEGVGRDNTYWAYKKGAADAVFSNGYPIIQIGKPGVDNGKIYKILLRNTAEDKMGFVYMLRDETTTRCHQLLGYIESTDGVTWRNAGNTYAKDVVVDGFITNDESKANCIIEYNATPGVNHWFCQDGLIVGGVPYLVIQEGVPVVPNELIYISLQAVSVRYFKNGVWNRKVIPNFITGMPDNRYYSEAQRFHLIHDGLKFILFVLSKDSKSMRKFSTTDFETWLFIETIDDGDGFFYGIIGTAPNNPGITLITKHSPETNAIATPADYSIVMSHLNT